VLAEGMSNTGSVFVNGKPFKKGSKSILKSGDEITVTGTKSYTYVFQSTRSEGTSMTSSSLSSYSSTRSGLESPSGSVISCTFLFGQSNIVVLSKQRNRKKSASLTEPVSSVETEMSSESADTENNNSTTKEKEALDTLKKQLKQDFAKQIINSKDIDITFENFPYYLNETTKQQLLSSAFVYLVKPEYAKYLTDLPITRRVLLSGPTGTDIYQEKLGKALAHYFKANLLILDPSAFEADKPSPNDDDFPDDMDFELGDYPRTHSTKHKSSRSNCHGSVCRVLRPGLTSGTSKPASIQLYEFSCDNYYRSFGSFR
jgi:hypothetical protein